MADNPLAPIVAADSADGAPLMGAAGVGAPPADAEDPIHGALRTCGVAAQASRMTFINVEGLDSIAAFAMMSGDNDVTEMAKRMAASRPTAAGRVLILGTMQIKRIQALVHCVKDYDKRGLVPEPPDM